MNKFVAKYGRILVPLITPYGENEEVDYVQYEKLIDYIITNKLEDSLKKHLHLQAMMDLFWSSA